VRIDEIDYFEINEAFSVVAEANCKVKKTKKIDSYSFLLDLYLFILDFKTSKR
jgi:hypothetical protein